MEQNSFHETENNNRANNKYSNDILEDHKEFVENIDEEKFENNKEHNDKEKNIQKAEKFLKKNIIQAERAPKKEKTDENKKTILIATDCFMPRIDGVSRFLEMLIPYLIEYYNVIVIAPDFKGTFIKNAEYDIFRVPLSNIKIGDYNAAKIPDENIIKLIDKADIVFSQTIGPVGSTIIKHARKKGKKILAFIHSIEWLLVEKSISKFNFLRILASNYAKRFAKKIYNKCDILIVPSYDVGEILFSKGIKRPKIVVHLGIDTEKFIPTDKEKAKKDIGLDKTDFVIGYVGRIAREKNLITLKKAFKRVHGQNNKLIFVGEGIKKLEEELKGDDPNILITGKTDDVVKYLNAMDVFVMPSLTETTCLATLEAMSCEIPVIVTKVGSMKDYVKEKYNGFFFPKENDLVLGLKINNLKENPKKRAEIGKNARWTVVKNYNYKRTFREILRIFYMQLK